MSFGEHLRQALEHKGWSQPVAAQQIGIEQSYLSKLETSNSYPSNETFTKLQKAYGFNLDEVVQFMGDEELRKLREVNDIRRTILRRRRDSQTGLRNWMLAGVAGLAIGGGFLGAAIVPDTADRQYHYRSEGILQPNETLTAFGAIH